MKSASAALVTGGTGFLGRRLVERLLAQGRQVTVLARRPAPDLEARGVRWVEGSVIDEAAVRRACEGVATVFHVAARVGVWGRYEDFFATNVLGTRRVLAACRAQGVERLVHTSTPSVVYNGQSLAGVDESLPLTERCPSPYPVTKAIAEREVLRAADGGMAGRGPGSTTPLRTVALRPHLIWGVGDPHLVPRVLARARAGRLRQVGEGRNRVDLVHVENAVDAHLAAERALTDPLLAGHAGPANGRAYFITNGEPVELWGWIQQLLAGLGFPPVNRRISRSTAWAVGGLCEAAWRWGGLRGEPPMTRFVADELARDHWFSIEAARRDLGYQPRVSMAEGTAALIAHLRAGG